MPLRLPQRAEGVSFGFMSNRGEGPGWSRRALLSASGAAAGGVLLGCEAQPSAPVKAPPRDVVLSTEPLGLHFSAADPFLFCAYHDDTFPRGNERLGPVADLAGRQLGSDFALKDGFRMYHGREVPGFPQHPHRGFETVSLARRGYIDHADSLGATARYGQGDVQWMTAGRGIVHSEMFPLTSSDTPNPLEMFQVWLNLPASDKLCEPSFHMMWSEAVPRVVAVDADGRQTEVTLIAGQLGDVRAQKPPPHSWAARADSDVAIWTLRLAPGAHFTIPPAQPGSNRTLYFFKGSRLEVGARALGPRTGARVIATEQVQLVAGDSVAEVLMLQGRPIGEPVAQRGPFVMNTDRELRQAVLDYQTTRFGGWPWSRDDLVHGAGDGRFARHVDGRWDRPA